MEDGERGRKPSGRRGGGGKQRTHSPKDKKFGPPPPKGLLVWPILYLREVNKVLTGERWWWKATCKKTRGVVQNGWGGGGHLCEVVPPPPLLQDVCQMRGMQAAPCNSYQFCLVRVFTPQDFVSCFVVSICSSFLDPR